MLIKCLIDIKEIHAIAYLQRKEAGTMAKAKGSQSSGNVRQIRPALTPEARQNQLIALATDLVEKRLIEGTASSQETTHFLKLATQEAKLKVKILEKQEELISAKTESIKSSQRTEELYRDAIIAMRKYSGGGTDGDF